MLINGQFWIETTHRNGIPQETLNITLQLALFSSQITINLFLVTTKVWKYYFRGKERRSTLISCGWVKSDDRRTCTQAVKSTGLFAGFDYFTTQMDLSLYWEITGFCVAVRVHTTVIFETVQTFQKEMYFPTKLSTCTNNSGYSLWKQLIQKLFAFALFFQIISCSFLYKSLQVIRVLLHAWQQVVQYVAALVVTVRNTKQDMHYDAALAVVVRKKATCWNSITKNRICSMMPLSHLF